MKCRKCRAEIPDGSAFCLKCGAKQDVTRKPKTRGNGTGSVYKLANGSWIAVRSISSTIDETGKMHRKTVSKSGFKTKREAIEYLPLLKEKPKHEKDITFKALYDLWEPTHKRSASTLGNYRAALNYFRPVWYDYISEITIDDLQDCLDDCTQGKRTKENMKALCGLLYKYAIPRHYATLNMGQYLVINADGGIGKEGLPMAALDKIKEAVGKISYADYIVAQCYLGFRPSEFLALTCKDYNKKQKTLIGGAKTDAGKNRTVTISPKVQPIIDAHTKDRIAGASIFGDAKGQPMSIEDYRATFYRVLEQCGIENPITEVNGVKRRRYTPHSCRHTFSTLMKNVQGADKDKLALIGHTSTETLRHYQDVDLEGLRKITDAI